MDSKSERSRRLRTKERKQYSEDCLQDEDIEGQRLFSVDEKLTSDKFEFDFVKEMKGEDFTLEYFQREGFKSPLVFKEKANLGLRMPSENFSVNEVRQCVGSRRVVDVMDVTTQKDAEMTMKEWCQYYEDPNRSKLLNVISLEFSHTKLENYVESPEMVRKVDWVDCVWPRHLKESQTVSTNSLWDMKYPKVQKYCLMSVKGCYTDFHIDFGGTSVWYHIIRGQKVFWLIPPTEENISRYEQWVRSGKQGDVFFGDMVPKCARVNLEKGYTFFIPTGWIHAVYTPEDSLVFGGNFLHSFGIEKQLRIHEVEDNTKVPFKFRYPFYTELHWYVLQRYVSCLMARNHLSCNEDGEEIEETPDEEKQQVAHSNGVNHLTKYEINGLVAIIKHLERLPPAKRDIPILLKDSHSLLEDAKTLLQQHWNDDQSKVVTGKLVLSWKDSGKKKIVKQGKIPKAPKLQSTSKNGHQRHRRTRCKKCEPCLRNDCEECNFCRDMKKYGGPGRMKQSCSMRNCVGPTLAHSALCNICKNDGWTKVEKICDPDLCSLMECVNCWEIIHPSCLHESHPELPLEGDFNDDLPSSWVCPKCVKDGAPEDLKPRTIRNKKSKADEEEKVEKKRNLEEPEDEHITKKPYLDSLEEQNKENTKESLLHTDRAEGIVEENVSLTDDMSTKDIKSEHLVFNLKNETEDETMGEGEDSDALNEPKIFERDSIASGEPMNICHVTDDALDGTTNLGNVITSVKKEGSIDTCDSSKFIEEPSASKNNFRSLSLVTSNILGDEKEASKYSIQSTSVLNNGLKDADSTTLNKVGKIFLNKNKLHDVNRNIRSLSQATNCQSSLKSPSYLGEASASNNSLDKKDDNSNQTETILLFTVSSEVPENEALSKSESSKKVSPLKIHIHKLTKSKLDIAMEKDVMLRIFSSLGIKDLSNCQLVCKQWNEWVLSPQLWKHVDVSNKTITPYLLMGIVKRQPISLNLNYSNIQSIHLSWLIARLPNLKHLTLKGCSSATVGALWTAYCPYLHTLDISSVKGLNDTLIEQLLLPPESEKSKGKKHKNRLRQIRSLNLSESQISDMSIRLIAHRLIHLTHLNLNNCRNITDMGIAVLGSVRHASLISLELSFCPAISDSSLEALSRCSSLVRANFQNCSLVSEEAIKRFATRLGNSFLVSRKYLEKQPI